MTYPLSVIFSACLFLTSCAAHTPLVEPLLQPCVIEGKHKDLNAVMTDPGTVVYDLYLFGGNAEDALARCNDEKAAALELIKTK